MKIYFRACEKIPTVSEVPRWNSEDKLDILKKCYLSMQPTIDENDIIYLFNDNLSKNTVEYLIAHTKATVEVIDIPEHKITDRLHTHKLIENVARIVNDSDEDEIHYLVEDDYLHLPSAINVLKEVFKVWDGYAITYDYPDRYSMENFNCELLLGPTCHWRTNPSATYTFAGKTTAMKIALPIMQGTAPHNPTIEMFKELACVSPVPGLSTHLTKYHMTPLQDWKSVWDDIKI
jgi:hypothetical protein